MKNIGYQYFRGTTIELMKNKYKVSRAAGYVAVVSVEMHFHIFLVLFPLSLTMAAIPLPIGSQMNRTGSKTSIILVRLQGVL